jgi:tetratricopeptide (TPR) repeat protein
MPLALRPRAAVATRRTRIETKTATYLSLTTISWTGFLEKIARRGAATTSKGLQEANFSTVLPNRSLLAGISSNTTSRRAAALRFAERGRNLIQTKEYQKAISFLEKALNLDASPFIYYYLARAHYHLGNNQGSLNFLEVAESRLSAQPEWAEELAALRSTVSAPQVTQYAMSKKSVGLTYTEY